MSLFDKDIITKFPFIDPDPIRSNYSVYMGVICSHQINISEMQRIQSHIYVNKYGRLWYVIDAD